MHVLRSCAAGFLNKKDGAIRLLQRDRTQLCVYPSVDSDPLFDKIRASQSSSSAAAGIDFQKRFAPYAEIEIQ